jgi:hypothetical protein
VRSNQWGAGASSRPPGHTEQTPRGMGQAASQVSLPSNIGLVGERDEQFHLGRGQDFQVASMTSRLMPPGRGCHNRT